MNTVLITLGVSFGLAFILGVLLGFFKKFFHVPVDPTVERVREVLPSANCGACGYPGCDGFAAAVAAGEAPVTGCTAGGPATAEAVGKVLGVDAEAVAKVALLACQGCKENAKDRGFYSGVKSCKAAKISVNGTKLCQFGCIGFGDCCDVCNFDALAMGEDGLPHVCPDLSPEPVLHGSCHTEGIRGPMLQPQRDVSPAEAELQHCLHQVQKM